MHIVDRKTFIGASEVGAVMGLSPWKTPLHLFAEKTGKLPAEDLSNFEAKEWGVRLEEIVAQKFSEKNNVKLMAYKKRFVHPKYEYISCELDRIITGTDELVEVKTCNAWAAKKWDGDEIPDEYVLQVNMQLGLSKRKKGWLAVLIGGNRYIEKFIEFDQELYDQEVEACRLFWNNFVLTDTPPLAQYGDNETLMMMFPSSTEKSIQFEDARAHELDNLVEYRDQLKEKIKAFQNCIEEVEPKIKQFLGEAELGETERYKISWKTQEKKEYTVKASKTRVLRITEKERGNDEADRSNEKERGIAQKG